jgi:hypothetical protein
MSEEKTIAVPKDLSPESAAWWVSVVETYPLEPHHIRLLTLAARELDRGEAARKAIAKNGMVYKDKYGVKRPSPETVIERNSAIAFARLIRELKLDHMNDEDEMPGVPRNSQNWKRRNEGWLKKDGKT